MSFVCCEERITNEDQFDSHFKRAHYNFQKVCEFRCLVPVNPVELCDLSVTNRYKLKRHFFRYHYELIKDIFSQKTLEAFSRASESRDRPLGGFDSLDSEGDYDYDCHSHDYQSGSIGISPMSELLGDPELAQGLNLQGEELTNPLDFVLSDEISELLIYAKSQLKMTESSIINFLKHYNQILLRSSPSSIIDKSLISQINEFTKSPYKVRKTILTYSAVNSNFECYEILNDAGSVFYYCPILEAIKKLVSDSRLLSILISEHNRPVDPNLLRTFKDGSLYSQMGHHPDYLELHLQLFTDDISLRDRGSHNEIIVGGSFENLPLQFMSKRNDMFLLLAAKRKDIEQSMHMKQLFAPLLKEIEDLNLKNLEVIDPSSQKKYILRVCLVTNIGDNKAMHELLGIPPANCRCRDCLITHARLNKVDLPFVTDFEPRQLNPAGHIFDGVLSSISNYPRDKFHDIAEGVCHKVLTPVLKSFYFNDTNVLVNKTKLFKHWRNGRIEGISDHKVKGTGMQVLEFFMLFPVLDDRVDRNSDWFRLIILLREIILFISCDVIPRNELNDFHQKVQVFQKLYFDLLTSKGLESFTMKVHYPIHYKSCIEESGPMAPHDTARGERFLKTIKGIVSNSLCTKNLIFTIVKNYQQYLQPQLFKNEDKFVKVRDISAADISNRLSSEFLPFIDLNSDLEELSSLTVFGIEINLNSVYVLGYESHNGNPMFIKLVKLFKQGNWLKLVGPVLRVTNYFETDCTYQVTNTRTLELLDLAHLAWHKELYFVEDVNNSGCDVVIRDFKSKASFHRNQEFHFI